MALQLPTDTASLRLETKQYELFNKRLGNGIQRRVLTIGVAVAVPWVLPVAAGGGAVVLQVRAAGLHRAAVHPGVPGDPPGRVRPDGRHGLVRQGPGAQTVPPPTNPEPVAARRRHQARGPQRLAVTALLQPSEGA